MISKDARHNFILQKVEENRIANQAELVESLRSAGFAVTQASISRDLQELGIVKQDGHYAISRTPAPNYGPLSLSRSGDSLLILHCLPGIASAIAVEIDKARIPEIAGTLAGDDTIFIASRTAKGRAAITATFRHLFGDIDEV
ncbi:MAG: arginine repressor [Acidobacteria bacterium]|nr:arginine repressor [Acidobacteriota bacterium]